MRWSWMAWMSATALLLSACGASEALIDCTTAADCEGDPGQGCAWACVDGECQADCPEACATAADCEELPWDIRCLGHWECNDGVCEAVCDEAGCTEVADCLDLVPPQDCSGHWECSMGECNWFCDSVACANADDCADLPWDLRCLGHWECNDGMCEAVCDEAHCQTDADCDDLVLPCESGSWICANGMCLPWCETTCASVADCLALPWLVDCLGHWSCEAGECVEVCDMEACGDGDCDTALGESAQSCPEDCLEQCRVADDCANLPWQINCLGHWECHDGVCEAVCDSQPECDDPIDCLGEIWDVRCYGHWACDHGQCEEVCDDERCGDGTCDPEGGESTDSCPEDCAAACVEAADCEDLFWPINCLGHWECRNGVCTPVCDSNPECFFDWECLELEWLVDCWGHWECRQGSCTEVCESERCGDEECDRAGGESADTCPQDCGVECQAPVDCLGLPWWVDCLGHWDCVGGQCEEVCDFDLCGDGTCDRTGGESAQSCPEDCAVCVAEGMPTPVPGECCEGLTGLNDCLPDSVCNGNLFFCLECGNGICEPHESPYNCLDDCPAGCQAGLDVGYECADGQEVPWCSCQAPACHPVCLYQHSDSEGWYDSCSGRLISYASCFDDNGRAHEAVCLYAGSWSEGWYDNSSEELIDWEFCSPRWDCLTDPKVNCL